ncbi:MULTISPECIES: Crp/Fnr family transcriptional regulator [unclassified Arcicella]|uniref:Crp/Fnr family transcriptional regulator n=1 Tax=unclassified Arcicella TaxID=2644986 RepID=UPI0028675F9F|nr:MULTISPECIES: Crp/Fnr family transcriptional regulator [unclassified Arcicella]MDR6564559.1 CRP-like cAMP-binding protein [Arcicella sp. BE51]MDR6825731.1 CRP-like cAMP-binding protein [Arcicella sp. BE139]
MNSQAPQSTYFEQINKNVCKNVAFSEEELRIFNEHLQYRKIKKKTFLLQEGEICNFEAFIIKGCMRKYYIDKNGFEVILQFAIEDWWVSDIASFHEQKPSDLFIEALEDCEIFVLTPDKKEDLLMKAPRFERQFRLLVQKNLSATQSRLINSIAQTAYERYADFLKKYPKIPQRVAQHYIASYLGISAEFLSKVRAKMAKNS